MAACASEKTVIMVSDNDPEMDAAIKQARAEVGAFVKRLQAPQAGDQYFSVKAPLRDGEQVEHFWLDGIRHEKGVFSGTLGNDPELVKGHKYGERIVMPESEISDWMYVENGVLVGGYTVRLLRKRMSQDQRSRLDAEMNFRFE
jgi:uncharacterized protein YegJ (DUF2314 family)